MTSQQNTTDQPTTLLQAMENADFAYYVETLPNDHHCLYIVTDTPTGYHFTEAVLIYEEDSYCPTEWVVYASECYLTLDTLIAHNQVDRGCMQWVACGYFTTRPMPIPSTIKHATGYNLDGFYPLYGLLEKTSHK